MYFKRNNQRIASFIFYFVVVAVTLIITDSIASLWLRMASAVVLILIFEGLLELAVRLAKRSKKP